MIDLREAYNTWRVEANEFEKEEGQDVWHCSNPACIENFSEFVGYTVTFDEMFILERDWNALNW